MMTNKQIEELNKKHRNGKDYKPASKEVLIECIAKYLNKAARLEKGLTASDVAKALNVPSNLYEQMESDADNANAFLVLQACDYLEVHFNEV